MSYFEYLSNMKNFYSYYKYEPAINKYKKNFLVKKNSYIKIKTFSEKWIPIPINKDILLI
jgi:hypothetical protein